MPEVAIDENNLPALRKHEVGPPRQRMHVFREPNPQPPYPHCHDLFWLGPKGANCPHVRAALRSAQRILR
jgi:hypothetical protein